MFTVDDLTLEDADSVRGVNSWAELLMRTAMSLSLTYTINKASNPMKVKAKRPTAKAAKNTTIKKADAFKVSKAKGKEMQIINRTLNK